ncbi:MAG: hypothetical protein NTY02_16010 [Acidobacteria bacterium]|nr:hypothetical protein [Acidobacteriota bacterium]
MAEAFGRALQAEPASTAGAIAGGGLAIENGHALHALIESDTGLIGALGRTLGVLCLRNDGSAELMSHAAVALSHATRVADLIFQPAPDSLVALMPDCDASAGQIILDRIAASLPEDVIPPPMKASPLRVAFACSPNDGDSVRQLLDAAQARLETDLPPVAAEQPMVLAEGGAWCN